MVAIKNKIRLIILTLTLSVITLMGLGGVTTLSAQGDEGSMITARIEELSGDLNYMSLLTLDAQYSAQSDSLNKALTEYRKVFIIGGDEAMDAQAKISLLEQSIFEIRKERSNVNEQIEAIEKQWREQNSEGEVVEDDSRNNLNNSSTTSSIDIYPTEIVGLISQSSVVKSTLSKEDLESLDEADHQEAKISALYQQFMDDYVRASELQQLYNQTEIEQVALSYAKEFDLLHEQMDSISNMLSPIWLKVYDDKLFIYSLLLETLNDNEVLQDGLNSIRKAEIAASEIGDNVAYESIISYVYKKLALVEFESAIAERFNLPRAVDSLLDTAEKLTAQRKSTDLPELSIKERNFILYEPIVYSTTTIYDSNNAIPQTIHYIKGDVYRVLFGSYKAKQDVSTFKGAAPLSVEQVDGMYRYYGGSYATYLEVEAAVAKAKERGFKSPEMVVWLDGKQRNLSQDPLPADDRYNIVIEGSPTLADESSTIIEKLGGGATLTRIATNKYVVTPLRNILIAEDLKNALSNINREVIFAINKITD